MKDWNSISIDRYYQDINIDTKIGIGILDLGRDISSHMVRKRSFDMTFFYINRMLKMGLCSYRGFETKVKTILENSLNAGDSYCMIAAQGLLLFRGPSLAVMSSKYAKENPDFFVIGHIMAKKDRYPGLHRQYLFVNLKVWDKLGRPDFDEMGYFSDRPREYIDYELSESTVYSDYTPIWIKKKSLNRQKYKFTNDGSNWIDVALTNDITIDNLSNEMRETKVFLYPYERTEILEQTWYTKDFDLINNLENYSQKAWLRKLGHQEQVEKDRVYAFNTEKLSAEGIRSNNPIDAIFSAAAGFKPLALLHNNRFHEQTVVHYFDWCPASLNYKKHLLETWDGIDLHKWLIKHDLKYNFSSTYRGNFEEFWIKELEEFGGPDVIKLLWDRYKNLEHHFHVIDIVNEPEKLFELINKAVGNKMLWTTNIWSSELLHWNLEPEELEIKWARFESLIPDDLVLYGHDYVAYDMDLRRKNNIKLTHVKFLDRWN